MTAELYIRLIAETIVAFGLIYLVQRPLRKVKHRFVLGIIFVLKALATVYLGLMLIAIDYKIVWNHSYPFGALYLAMLGVRQYSEAELKNAIEGSGIRILSDEYVEINDDLVLLGREDVERPDLRKAVKDLPEVPEGRYVICIDHTPYQNEEIEALGADLQVSGHTHAAQYFPEMTVYKLLGLNMYGDYTIGDTHLVVSSGISGWALPLRSEAGCAYEVFELR